jgi:outer membrane protein assembly factor BamB
MRDNIGSAPSPPVETRPRLVRERTWLIVGVVLGLCLSTVGVTHFSPSRPTAPAGSAAESSSSIPLGVGTNYPTYLFDDDRTDSVGAEGPINASDAHNLQLLWSHATGGAVWAQPIVVDGIVYVGSSDGYEYARYATNGTLLWKTFLGIDATGPNCSRHPGVTSTATFDSGRLYVSAGNATFYAVNATTGRVVWDLPIGGPNANAGGVYLWASPLIYNQSAYVGISSQCDEPLVPAGLDRVSLQTHSEIAYFNSSVPDPNGSSIWGSPSLNEATNTIYVTTGEPYGQIPSSKYSESIVALNASTLSVVASWQVPAAEAIYDGDFGVTPTLFDVAHGVGVVAAENKNGYLYEWYQSNLSLVWQDDLTPTTTLDYADHFSTSYANGTLYAVGENLTIGRHTYKSSITAIDPADGAYLWQVGTNSTSAGDYAPPLYDNGVLVVPIGTTLYLLKAATGKILYEHALSGESTPPASVSRGEVFVGSGDNVTAFDLALHLQATRSTQSGPAPLTVNFTARATGGVPAYVYNWSFGDGTHSSSQDPTKVFTMPGKYSVRLTVTDVTGVAVAASFTITVTAPDRGPPGRPRQSPKRSALG